MTTATIASRIPGWLGFLVLILVGAAMTLNGIANSGLDPTNRLGFLVFGFCVALIGTVSWIAAASSKITGRVGKVGADVGIRDMPWWAWVIDAGVLVLAIVIFVVAR
jgi:hypothetical protein